MVPGRGFQIAEVTMSRHSLLVFVGSVALVGCSREIRYQPPPPVTQETVFDVKDAWVAAYDEQGFRGRTFTIKYPKETPDLGLEHADDGKYGFNDKARSVRWQIPTGWMFVLYDERGFRGNRLELIGTGKVESNVGPLTGDASSGRWERKP